MDGKRWIVVYGKYEGLQKRALNLINGAVFDLYKNYISFYKADEVCEELVKENNLIILGSIEDNCIIKEFIANGQITLPTAPQGYSIQIKDSPYNNDCQVMVICGADEHGVLYGAVDFVNKYCGYIIFKVGRGDMESDEYFKTAFNKKAPEWKFVSSPSIEERAIWTWGHCIYDYKAFFDNMVMLKLNQIVIWNDYAPINANEVVDYAHSLGIKVIWGFAWGWGVNCNYSMGMDEQSLTALKHEIIKKYESEYACIKGDGIYFQSCTELQKEYINGKLIAETVVNLVNDTASALLEKYPNLLIQFGLHSDSVKNRLEFIKKVDKRVMIVWENCGVFPFHSNRTDHLFNDSVEPVDKTVEFTKTICRLRSNDEKFGMVVKGVCTLDWTNFHHQQKNLILGEKSKSFIENRTKEKQRILKMRQALWVRFSDYVQKIIKGVVDVRNNLNVQMVLEDGMFEKEIPLSSAVYAQLLWDCNISGEEAVCEVMQYPCVKIANI